MYKKILLRPLVLLFLLFITCGSVIATAPLAHFRAVGAQTRTGDKLLRLEDAAIQTQIPANWKEKQDGQKIELVSPDKAIYIALWVSESKDTGEAAKELGRGVSLLLDEPKFGDPAGSDINGLPVLSISGTGSYQGGAVNFHAALLEAKKSVLMLIIGNERAMDKHKGEVDHIVKSVTRL